MTGHGIEGETGFVKEMKWVLVPVCISTLLVWPYTGYNNYNGERGLFWFIVFKVSVYNQLALMTLHPG